MTANDISMVREAGLGVVMEMVQGIVKEIADWVTDSILNNRVAKVNYFHSIRLVLNKTLKIF